MNQMLCNEQICNKRGICTTDGASLRCTCSCDWTGSVCTVCRTSSCANPCPLIPLLEAALSSPQTTATQQDAPSSGVQWWLPIAILVPICTVLVVSGLLVRQVLLLRKEAANKPRDKDVPQPREAYTAEPMKPCLRKKSSKRLKKGVEENGVASQQFTIDIDSGTDEEGDNNSASSDPPQSAATSPAKKKKKKKKAGNDLKKEGKKKKKKKKKHPLDPPQG